MVDNNLTIMNNNLIKVEDMKLKTFRIITSVQILRDGIVLGNGLLSLHSIGGTLSINKYEGYSRDIRPFSFQANYQFGKMKEINDFLSKENYYEYITAYGATVGGYKEWYGLCEILAIDGLVPKKFFNKFEKYMKFQIIEKERVNEYWKRKGCYSYNNYNYEVYIEYYDFRESIISYMLQKYGINHKIDRILFGNKKEFKRDCPLKPIIMFFQKLVQEEGCSEFEFDSYLEREAGRLNNLHPSVFDELKGLSYKQKQTISKMKRNHEVVCDDVGVRTHG